jgi:proton-translocating NADH-quinone oxidoreductase chain N
MVISPVQYIALPLMAAFLIPLFGKLNKELVRIIPGLVLLYLSYISVILMNQVISQNTMIVEIIAGWRPPWGINLVFSPFSGFLVSLFSILGFVIWLYTYNFKREVDDAQKQKFYILMMMLITGTIGIVLTGDIFNMFVFLEITAISAYSLTAFYRERDGAEAAFKYVLIGSFASFFILLAVVLLYTQVGTLNMADIAQKMPAVNPYMKGVILMLFFVGFGIEAEMFPLNGWAPDVYTQAPGPIGAIFAGMVVKAGIYGMVRVLFTLFDVHEIFPLLMIMGVITMAISEVIALRQGKLKRMLAYSSIGQMGLVLVAFGIGTREAVFAAIFLMFNHAIIKGLLFLSGTYLVYHSKEKKLSDLDGIGKLMPFTAFLFAIGSLAIVGLPPFSGFWSKLYILMAAADVRLIAVIAIILSVSIVEIVYYFRVLHRIYFRKRTSDLELKIPSINAKLSMLILALIIVVVGVYPDLISGLIHRAAADLLDKQHYIQSVLSVGLH